MWQFENFKNSRWRTTAILKIIISSYFNKTSSDFDEILYTTAECDSNEMYYNYYYKSYSKLPTSPKPEILKFSMADGRDI